MYYYVFCNEYAQGKTPSGFGKPYGIAQAHQDKSSSTFKESKYYMYLVIFKNFWIFLYL